MTTSPLANPTGADLALAAASAAAAVLPSVEPLMAAGAQPGNEHVTAAFSGAAIAELEGSRTGRIAVLVGAELTDALASSPLEGLDLAAATQPALDAVAATLGTSARAAQTVALDLVVSDLGPDFTVVPLIGTGIAASVLIQDHLLDQPVAAQPAAAEPVVAAQQVAEAVVDGPATVAAPVPAPTAASVQPVGTQTPAPADRSVTTLQPSRGIEMLHGVDMEVTVELGRTRMTVRDLLALTPGAVLELDRAAGSPADLLVNGRLIARGEVVVIDEDFGLRVTEIIDDSTAV
ncbi:MAG TPA: flagellar motor switch protein FliN [Marmoricola sp.]|nr:flagellar motor switch protein FliN [Marmoricola sp.]